ncbi:MAG: ATP-binding cassette domain-containing protein [Sphingobacterium sp.]
MSAYFNITNLSISFGNQPVLQNLDWNTQPGQQILIAGKSGSGKTTLGRAIAGLISTQDEIRHYSAPGKSGKPAVLYVSNWYQFTTIEGERNFYYQQRYNRHQGRDTLTVGADLRNFAHQEGLSFERLKPRIREFGFDQLIDSQLIELSSGEHKKLQLLKSLWKQPDILIIDQPYTGLDKGSRRILNQWLDKLASEGVQLILISNDPHPPECINCLVQIKNGKIVHADHLEDLEFDALRSRRTLPEFLTQSPSTDFKTIANLQDIQIRYGEKIVLDQVSWQVQTGEKWLLQGPNGSGKSTLLSLINGDHPQSYGLDIELFGRPRGSGESIWDIKEKIGMISPEMLWYFDQNATVWHTIASGFYDSIGWFIDVKFQEKQQIEELLKFFDLQEHKDQLLHTLPLGKQRLAMLARSIVKNPPLLVLDEPCQGLDSQQAQYFNDVVDELCTHGKTLIYVGHYESQLPRCIEKRIILDNGHVVAIENKVENVEI